MPNNRIEAAIARSRSDQYVNSATDPAQGLLKHTQRWFALPSTCVSHAVRLSLASALVLCLTVTSIYGAVANGAVVEGVVVNGAVTEGEAIVEPPITENQSALEQADRPNFIVILCDDLGYGDLGCYGHPAIQTPHLDGLASNSIRFTSFYSTAPVCSASRAGLLTGRNPSAIGVFDWIPSGHAMHLQADFPTIPRWLQSHGYATSLVGKWHCNGQFNRATQPQPDAIGFDDWFATQNNARPSHENPNNFVRNGENVGELEGYSCQLVVDEAIDWLASERDKEKPFFQFICFHEPHEPIASPAELVADYPDATAEGEALYFANVANMDAAVGRLLATLDALELADNTFILFTSDNGPETLNRYRSAWRSHGSPGPLRGMKLHVYDGGIRVAGICRFPSRWSEPRIIEAPAGAIDLFPTICDLAGIELPADANLEGTSLVPLLDGDAYQRQQPMFWYYYRALSKPTVAMRDGDWMLLGELDLEDVRGGVVGPGHSELIKQAQLIGFELYQISSDIAQQAELSSEHPEVFQRMSAQMTEILQRTQASAPDWDQESGSNDED